MTQTRATLRIRHLRAAELALARVDDQLRAAALACVGEDQQPADAPGWIAVQRIRELLAGTGAAEPRSEIMALLEEWEDADAY